MERAGMFLAFFSVFVIIEFIFMFKKSRNKEIHSDDDQSTPDIVENRYGDYCDECGATIQFNHKYCTNCGKEVRK